MISTARRATVLLAGSTTQTDGLPSDSMTAVRGSVMTGGVSNEIAAADRASKEKFERRAVEADLDWKKPCHRICLRRNLPDSARRLDTSDCRPARHVRWDCSGIRPDSAIWAGTSNTASLWSSRATRTIIWPARTNSPGSAPLAVTMPLTSASSSVYLSSALARSQSRLRGVQLRLRGLKLLLAPARVARDW